VSTNHLLLMSQTLLVPAGAHQCLVTVGKN
jgi:hypothetical protein